MKRNISKKPVIVLGTLLTLLVTVTVVYGVSHLEPKDVELNQLIESPYEILDVRRHKKEKKYEVDIKADLNYADNILLANKLLSELQKNDSKNVTQVHMNVYETRQTNKPLILQIPIIVIPSRQMDHILINTNPFIQKISVKTYYLQPNGRLKTQN